jgi:hypothetical protein
MLSYLAAFADCLDEQNFVQALDLVCEHRAEIEARDKNGQTTLSYITEQGAVPEAIQELLRRGADLNAKVNNGRTPISLAVTGSDWMDYDLIETLVAFNAEHQYGGQERLNSFDVGDKICRGGRTRRGTS